MDRIRIAMIGAGFAARLFIAAVEEVDEVEVAGVFSANLEHSAAFADEYRLTAFASLDAIADDPTVDAVYIGTPNSTHYALAVAMMTAGKHVLVEKPLATSAAEARALVQVAATRKVLLMEAYRAAFEPNIAVLRSACAELHPVRRAVLIMDQYSSRFDAFRAGQVHAAFDPARGGGSTMDLGFYPVALAVHLFGEPRTVAATGILLANGADAQGTILLGYDGFEVTCLHSKVATMGIESQVAGERAVLTFDDCASPDSVRLHTLGTDSRSRLAARPPREIVELGRPRGGALLVGELREFSRLVMDGERESRLHPLANSVAVAEILDEARRQFCVNMSTRPLG